MPKGIPLTPEEQSQRRFEIVGIAKNIFKEKGFQGTAMREIAEAVGMGKSSLYESFKTKDEILVFALEEEVLQLIEQSQGIAGLDLPPDIRLKQMMQIYLKFMQTNNTLFLWLSVEVHGLNAESQKRLQEKRYAYQDIVRSIIEEGISKSFFRKVNALNAARLLINSMLSILYTSRPTGSAEEMWDEAIEIFCNGIKM
ncbi:MAG TPA: TetR/AcrR family transcriptional regulator [Pelotomaculum sp.]|nr:TetR/AcrR family transcriptional regulator [Pelotomaculum sp.]